MKGVEISDCDTLVVEGRVEATLDSRVLEIAEHGVFQGTIAVDQAEIRGRFEGEITVRKQLIIQGTGKVSGKIRYAKIKVEEGAELAGDLAVLDKSATAAPRHQARRERLRPVSALAPSTLKEAQVTPGRSYPPRGFFAALHAAEHALALDEADHAVEALAGLQVGEDERPLAAHLPRVAVHHLERGADHRREVDLVDHQQIATW